MVPPFLSTDAVFQLISNLNSLENIRYTSWIQTDDSSFYVVIHKVIVNNVPFDYVISTSEANSSARDAVIKFYGVNVNNSLTLLTISEIIDTPLIAYSISKTLVFLFYNNKKYQLSFNVPYTDNINQMKQSILNLYTNPCRIYLLFGSMMIQYTYVQQIYYRGTVLGTYDKESDQFSLVTSFDYNKTLIGLMDSKAYFYWNTRVYSGLNPYPFIAFDPKFKDSIVIGFQNNFLIRTIPGFTPDLVANVSSYSLNVDELSGNSLTFISLTDLLPLSVTSEIQYYFTGFGGTWSLPSSTPDLYAVLQTVYLKNTDNVYATSSFKIIFVDTSDHLRYMDFPSYCVDDKLCFYLDVDNEILYIDNLESFYNYVQEHTGTIMTSDLTFSNRSNTTKSFPLAYPIDVNRLKESDDKRQTLEISNSTLPLSTTFQLQNNQNRQIPSQTSAPPLLAGAPRQGLGLSRPTTFNTNGSVN